MLICIYEFRLSNYVLAIISSTTGRYYAFSSTKIASSFIIVTVHLTPTTGRLDYFTDQEQDR